jgi:hypothetical protein
MKSQKVSTRVLQQGDNAEDHSHVRQNAPIDSKRRELAEIPRSEREKQTSRLRSQNRAKQL